MNASSRSSLPLFSLFALPFAALLTFAACTNTDDVVIGTDNQAVACTTNLDCPSAKPCIGGLCSESGSADGGISPGSMDGGGCASMPPSAEVCDGIDNDCDGIVDNKASCISGAVCIAGACVFIGMDGGDFDGGSPVSDGGDFDGGFPVSDGGDFDGGSPVSDGGDFDGGSPVSDGGCMAQGEECDGVDNDCNGIVDDNATCPAGGVCIAGVCSFGAVDGGSGCVPTLEVCDGIDNDCDGVVDDSAFCQAGSSCFSGVCITGFTPCMSNANCGPGQSCVANICTP